MKARVSVHLMSRPCLPAGEGAGLAHPWQTEVFSTLGAALDVVRAETSPTIWRTMGPGVVGRVWTQVAGVPRELRCIARPTGPRTKAPWVDPVENLDWVHVWEHGTNLMWMLQAIANAPHLPWRVAFGFFLGILREVPPGEDAIVQGRVNALVARMEMALRECRTRSEATDFVRPLTGGSDRDDRFGPFVGLLLRTTTRVWTSPPWAGLMGLRTIALEEVADDAHWAKVIRGAVSVDDVFAFHASRARGERAEE